MQYDSWNDPAFPSSRASNSSVDGDGLSKREYLIAAALQGLLANPDNSGKSASSIARLAKQHAEEICK